MGSDDAYFASREILNLKKIKPLNIFFIAVSPFEVFVVQQKKKFIIILGLQCTA